MPQEDSLYPLELVVQGTPISQQASPRSRGAWMKRIEEAATDRQRETCELVFLDDRALAVTIYFFASARMTGDIDNIVKPVLDAMKHVAYQDDQVVERVIAQKFEPEVDWAIVAPSDRLAFAMDMAPPAVYICVDDDLSWRQA